VFIWFVGVVVFKFMVGKISYLHFLIALPFIILVLSFFFERWLQKKFDSKLIVITQWIIAISIFPS